MRVVARLCPNASAQPDVERAEILLGNEALYLLGTILCPLTATRAKAFRRVALGTHDHNMMWITCAAVHCDPGGCLLS